MLEETTHREFLIWRWWFDNRHEYPTADNMYQMQVAQCVRQVLSKQPEKIKLKDFVLLGKGKRKKPVEKSQVALLQQMWLGKAGAEPAKPLQGQSKKKLQ